MTIASQTSRISYTGDGSTTAFAVPFYFQANVDLVVYLTDLGGNATLQVLGTGYNLTGATVSSGGTCTFTTAPPVGYVIAIYRDPAMTQTTSYNNNDPFPAKSHELALDKALTIDQRTRDLVSRSVHLNDADPNAAMILPTLAIRKGKILGFSAADGSLVASNNTLATLDSVLSGALATSGGLNRVVLSNTYSDLRSLTPFAGAVVLMQGYTAVNDGGGGVFIWNASSTATHNGGTIIQPLAGGIGRWIRMMDNDQVNVMWFGAVGDGTTNDSAAFQAAIDSVSAGGDVFAPGRTFNLVTGVTISHFGVRLRGAGKNATTLLFSPTTAGTLITVSMGALEGSYGGIYDLSIYSNDTTRNKIAINIKDWDIYEVHSVSINGAAGWTGAGSIGIKTNGRDIQSFTDNVIFADQCIYIGINPNHPISADHYCFHNLYLGGGSSTLPLIDVQSGANLTNITFSGYQAWVQGAGGFRWIDTTTVGVSQAISFSNVRLEQTLDATQFAFDIQPNVGCQNLSFHNIAVGDRKGWRLRRCQNPTISDSMFVPAPGSTVALDVDSTCNSLEWRNTFFLSGHTASLSGLYQQIGFPSDSTTALPYSARYLNSANFPIKSQLPLSGDAVTIVNNGVASITSLQPSCFLIVSCNGRTAMFGLFGVNHVTAEISDFGGLFSVTAGTATSTNIYWSAGNSRYEIENKTGGTQSYTFTFLGST